MGVARLDPAQIRVQSGQRDMSGRSNAIFAVEPSHFVPNEPVCPMLSHGERRAPWDRKRRPTKPEQSNEVSPAQSRHRNRFRYTTTNRRGCAVSAPSFSVALGACRQGTQRSVERIVGVVGHFTSPMRGASVPDRRLPVGAARRLLSIRQVIHRRCRGTGIKTA